MSNNPKRDLRDEIVELAERCQSNPARYSQAAASILLGLAGALSADQEEALMHHTILKFAQSEVRRLSASHN